MTIRFSLITLILLGLNSCSLITTPVKVAGKVATTSVGLAGKVAGAGIGLVSGDDEDSEKKDED